MISFLVLCVILGLAGSAFYSGLETGIVSVNPLRLHHLRRKNFRHAETLYQLIAKPDHLLGTALVGNNLCNIIASISAVSLGTALAGQMGYLIAYVSITLLMLVFGEYLPKAWFQGNPARRVLPFIYLFHLNGRIFYPLSRLATGLTQILLPLPLRKEAETGPSVTRDELHALTRATHGAGSLSQHESRRVNQVFALSEKTVGQLMIPLGDVICVDLDTPVSQILDLAIRHDITRMPVRALERDRFAGIVTVFDLFRSKEVEGRTARDFLRPPQSVQENSAADDLLARMRMSRQPMTLVTGNDAKVIGIITPEDILRELFGPL